jgi:hypothetical protein
MALKILAAIAVALIGCQGCHPPPAPPTPLPLSALQGDAGDVCHSACSLLRKNLCDGIGPDCEVNCENDELQGAAQQGHPEAIVAAGSLQELGAAAGTTCSGAAPGVGLIR